MTMHFHYERRQRPSLARGHDERQAGALLISAQWPVSSGTYRLLLTVFDPLAWLASSRSIG